MVSEEKQVKSEYLEAAFITGPGGSGKTHSIQMRLALGEQGLKLSSTSGISAVNLGEGVSTVHSTLGFFDESSAKDRWVSGRLTQSFECIMREGTKEIVIDEISLLSGGVLDCLWKAAEEASERMQHTKKDWQPFRFTCTGDYCQLPPVKADRWAFEADCWSAFMTEDALTRLTTIHRQSDPIFLAAMAFARAGKGPEAVEALQASGVHFADTINDAYVGATLVGKNDEANRFNALRLGSIKSQLLSAKNSRWIAEGASAPSEWKHIPEALQLKVGALVMLKTNSLPDFRYANGDLGIIEGWDAAKRCWQVRLKRSDEVVEIGRVTRQLLQKDLPPWFKETAMDMEHAREKKLPFPNWEGKWILGECTYWPMKLAYSATIHSSQGLTLDSIQFDCRNHFTGEPAMAYVALSRARTPQGLRIVGTPEKLAKRIKSHTKAAQWI